jgi:broad specificity phosphatase PhoE
MARSRILTRRRASPKALTLCRIAQATAAGESLKDWHFDKIIVSGLPRTVQTLERVLAQNSAFEMRRAEHEVWPEWIEIKGGKPDALPEDALLEGFLGAFNAGAPSADTRYMGGESIGELCTRVEGGIARLLADPSWDQALLVLHGAVNRAFLSYALNGGRCFPYFAMFQQAPACINVLDVSRERPQEWIIRASNVNPTDWLHSRTRATTMEEMFAQYRKWRVGL